jgi:hypothetical protein
VLLGEGRVDDATKWDEVIRLAAAA